MPMVVKKASVGKVPNRGGSLDCYSKAAFDKSIRQANLDLIRKYEKGGARKGKGKGKGHGKGSKGKGKGKGGDSRSNDNDNGGKGGWGKGKGKGYGKGTQAYSVASSSAGSCELNSIGYSGGKGRGYY
ncbi:hypothetical protein FOZ62_032161 [Perkinsus olseni]|uniref:Uncharacterized protein n=1 Tax=Perkinsus olseni TaxID=32597 RepID=A0A7J6R416_PEROL|nr:hypothetical protein FOZ62_032161 [Perkinsus olseni]